MAAPRSAEITQIYERNQEATLYVGNLDHQVTEELLWEFFLQCGPIKNAHIPRDKITSQHSNYGFVEFLNETDADYAMKIMNMIKLYGKPIRCNKASQDKRTQEVGANLFIGNLDPDVDEKLLFDTFSAFGVIVYAKVMRDPETGISKGYGFASFDSFEASDACMAVMHGQFLCNRPIHVSYAYKKDTKGERHGSAAERLIAANRPQNKIKPGPAFVDVPSQATMQSIVAMANQAMLPPLPPVPMSFGQTLMPDTSTMPPFMGQPVQHAAPNPMTNAPVPDAKSMQPIPPHFYPDPAFGGMPGRPPLAQTSFPPNMSSMPTGLPPPPMLFGARPGVPLPPVMPIPGPGHIPGAVPMPRNI